MALEQVAAIPLLADCPDGIAFRRQIKIADFVVGCGAIPHPPLRIAEELAYRRLWMRKRILDDLPRPRIKPSDQIHVVGVIPKISVGIKTKTVRTRIRARERKFLKRFRLGVEPGHFPAAKFSRINHAIGANFHAPRISIRRWWTPSGNLHRFSVHFADFARQRACKPSITILVRLDVVRIFAFDKMGELPGLGIEARQRDTARPNLAGWIDSNGMLRTAILDPLFS